MNAIHIDFAPLSIGREIASLRPLSWLLASIGLALCIGSLVALIDLAQQQGAWLAEVEKLHAQASVHPVPAPSTAKISTTQAAAVNSAIQQLNLPWSGLLDAVERATPSTVALLELEPDAKRHLLKGVAETRTADMMIDYIGRLKQQHFFGNVVLTRHDANNQDANKSVRFEFEAEWRQAEQ